MDRRTLNQTVLGFLLPQVCAHCREDLPADGFSPLCLGCRPKLPPSGRPFCERCAEPTLGQAAHCARCANRLFACGLVRAAFQYREACVSLVHAFKFRGLRGAARTAGTWMGLELGRFPELGECDALVPVPLHARRRRERGYNQAKLIAEGLSEAARAPVEELVLRVRETRPLWSLSRDDRKQALAGAFACPAPERVAGRRFWLVDDVCTSGASLEGCAQALLDAGALSAAGYVFARQAQPLVQ